MITAFLSHIYKRFFRSSSAGKEIAAQVTLGIIVLVVAAYSLAFGFVLESIIVKGLKQSNSIIFLNGLLIYYFIGEFVMRYFMQSLPALDVQPYLHLPVARSRIVHFLLARSMVHVSNIFVFLLFTPFAMNVVATAYGKSQAWVWLLSIWFLSLANHFLVVLFKKYLDDNVWGLFVFVALTGVLAASDYFGWFQLSTLSEIAYGTTLQGYTAIGALFLVVVFLYLIAYSYFINRVYPEELNVPDNQSFHSANLGFLQKFGVIGTWIKVELKLIFRHKRTRTVFFMNIVMVFYSLILYHYVKHPAAYAVFLFYGIISTGIFAINYGQFLFSWQGEHFDLTLTQPTSIRRFVESKYWLLASFTGLWFLLTVPFLYLGWRILLVNLACTLFNIGINIFIVMNMAMWGTRRIDLAAGGSLNYEGMGAAQWTMAIPFIFSPYVFFLPFRLLGYPVAGVVAVGVAGFLGLVFRKKLIDITTRRLLNMRYAIASNFRKD